MVDVKNYLFKLSMSFNRSHLNILRDRFLCEHINNCYPIFRMAQIVLKPIDSPCVNTSGLVIIVS